MILGDLGYGTALVQAPNASQRRASTAYWCALGAGMIGSGIVVLGAYPAARLLGESEVTGLVIAGGLTLFLVAAGSTSNALLTRSMSFGVIQGAGMIAALIATASAVVAAVLGAGAWALVLQQVVLAAVTSACFIVAARWHPSLEFSRAAMRSLTRFAVPYTAGSAFIVFQGLVTVLLVGALLGLEELGIWNLSMAIVVVPMTLLAAPISRVVYAAFARMRDDQERVTEVWLNGFTMLAAVLLPVLFCLIAVAPDLVPLAFGRQWVAAVPVVQTLCVLIMSRALQQWNVAVLDAAGRPQVNMLLTGAVLIALPPSILVGKCVRNRGCRSRLRPRGTHFRRAPRISDHDTSPLVETAQRAWTYSRNRVLGCRGMHCCRLRASGAGAWRDLKRTASGTLDCGRRGHLLLAAGALRARRVTPATRNGRWSSAGARARG